MVKLIIIYYYSLVIYFIVWEKQNNYNNFNMDFPFKCQKIKYKL